MAAASKTTLLYFIVWDDGGRCMPEKKVDLLSFLFLLLETWEIPRRYATFSTC